MFEKVLEFHKGGDPIDKLGIGPGHRKWEKFIDDALTAMGLEYVKNDLLDFEEKIHHADYVYWQLPSSGGAKAPFIGLNNSNSEKGGFYYNEKYGNTEGPFEDPLDILKKLLFRQETNNIINMNALKDELKSAREFHKKLKDFEKLLNVQDKKLLESLNEFHKGTDPLSSLGIRPRVLRAVNIEFYEYKDNPLTISGYTKRTVSVASKLTEPELKDPYYIQERINYCTGTDPVFVYWKTKSGKIENMNIHFLKQENLYDYVLFNGHLYDIR